MLPTKSAAPTTKREDDVIRDVNKAVIGSKATTNARTSNTRSSKRLKCSATKHKKIPSSLSWFTSIDKDVSGIFSLPIQHYLSRSSVSDTTTYETDVPVNGGLTRKCAPLIANELIGTHQVLDALTQSHFIGQTVIDCALYNLAQCDDNISAIPSAVWTPQQGEAPISAWNKYYDKRHHLSSKEHPHLTILPIINDRHWTVLVRYSFGYVQHGQHYHYYFDSQNNDIPHSVKQVMKQSEFLDDLPVIIKIACPRQSEVECGARLFANAIASCILFLDSSSMTDDGKNLPNSIDFWYDRSNRSCNRNFLRMIVVKAAFSKAVFGERNTLSWSHIFPSGTLDDPMIQSTGESQKDPKEYYNFVCHADIIITNKLTFI